MGCYWVQISGLLPSEIVSGLRIFCHLLITYLASTTRVTGPWLRPSNTWKAKASAAGTVCLPTNNPEMVPKIFVGCCLDTATTDHEHRRTRGSHRVNTWDVTVVHIETKSAGHLPEEGWKGNDNGQNLPLIQQMDKPLSSPKPKASFISSFSWSEFKGSWYSDFTKCFLK